MYIPQSIHYIGLPSVLRVAASVNSCHRFLQCVSARLPHFFRRQSIRCPGSLVHEAGIRVRVYRTDVPASSGLGGQQQVENDLPDRRQPAYYRIIPPGRTRSLGTARAFFQVQVTAPGQVRAIPNHRASPLHRSTGVLCARASLKRAALASGSVPKAIIPVGVAQILFQRLEC